MFFVRRAAKTLGKGRCTFLCMTRTHLKPRHAKRQPPPHYLRAWREERQLTQEQLAERIDYTHGTISRLETGRNDLTQEMILKLSSALRIWPGDLFRSPRDDQGIWSFAQRLAILPAERRKLAMELLETLIANSMPNDQGAEDD